MKTTLTISVLLILLLSSCTPTPPQPLGGVTPLAVLSTESPPATEEIPSTPIIPAEPVPTSEAAQPGLQAFRIVPGESRVQYEVGETFLNDNNRFAVAIGVTPEVNGEVFANLADPPQSSLGVVTVDVSQFTSDSARRDSAIRSRFLESSRFPLATFSPNAIEGLPDSYIEGQDYPIRITGDLTVREVTAPAIFEVTIRLEGGTLTGKAVTEILMSDFNVGPISLAGILQTEDKVKISFDFVARPE